MSREVEREQARVLAGRRTARDQHAVRRALAGIVAVAPGRTATWSSRCSTPCRAEATLGEICDVLRTVWGTYTETANF